MNVSPVLLFEHQTRIHPRALGGSRQGAAGGPEGDAARRSADPPGDQRGELHP
jgi:hypothetical protein